MQINMVSDKPDNQRQLTDAAGRLAEELNARVNPEVFRNFSTERFEQSRAYLEELSRLERLAPRGQRVAVVGSNGKGSTSYYLTALLMRARATANETAADARGPNEARADARGPTKTAADTRGPSEARADARGPTETAADARGPGEARADTHGLGSVGLYTSPHLLSVTERIRLDLAPVEAEELWASYAELVESLDERQARLTYFEILTVMALHVFGKRRCPYQVYEAGLGGRLDATRMARAQTVVLTAIELEHAALLGDSLEAILDEKLGIITDEARLLVAMPQRALADELIVERARRIKHDIAIRIFDRPLEQARQSYLEYNRDFACYCLTAMQETFGTAFGVASAGAAFGPVPASAAFGPASAGGASSSVALSSGAFGGAALPTMPGRLETRVFRTPARSIPLCYDTAHNAPALELALDNYRRTVEFPGTERALVLIGTLKDRSPAELIAVARRAGYRHVVQLTGSFLRDPEAPDARSGDSLPEAARAPGALSAESLPEAPDAPRALSGDLLPEAPAAPTVPLEKLTEFCAAYIEENDIACGLMTGSHRLYAYFRDMCSREK